VLVAFERDFRNFLAATALFLSKDATDWSTVRSGRRLGGSEDRFVHRYRRREGSSVRDVEDTEVLWRKPGKSGRRSFDCFVELILVRSERLSLRASVTISS
jgi:hypothetical protein